MIVVVAVVLVVLVVAVEVVEVMKVMIVVVEVVLAVAPAPPAAAAVVFFGGCREGGGGQEEGWSSRLIGRGETSKHQHQNRSFCEATMHDRHACKPSTKNSHLPGSLDPNIVP